MITNVTYTDFFSDTLRYNVTCVSGEYKGGWIEYFKDIIKKGQKFVIRENEVLNRLRQFNEDLSINETFSASADAVESRVGFALVGFSEVGA